VSAFFERHQPKYLAAFQVARRQVGKTYPMLFGIEYWICTMAIGASQSSRNKLAADSRKNRFLSIHFRTT
jgi:hypothetical protein